MTMLENQLGASPLDSDIKVVNESADQGSSKETAKKTVLGPEAPIEEFRIHANLTLHEDGAIATREAVTRDDLHQVLTETWFHGYLRKGVRDVRFDDAVLSMQPIYNEEDADRHIITAYALIATLPDGTKYTRAFTPHSIPYASQRGGERLLAAGQLDSKKTFFYDFEVAHQPQTTLDASSVPQAANATKETIANTNDLLAGMTFVDKTPPLRWVNVPLSQLLNGATEVGQHDKRNHYVFYTAAARERLEHFSRLGMQQSPAVETGAALVGTLGACPDTGEMFDIITDVLQVTDSDATEMSLEYTSESWQRISTIIDAMGLSLMGQGHGHNFMPAKGAQPCEACALAERCTTSSVFASTDDLNWTRAVFPHEPFALCHIFGLTARHMRPNPDEVDTLYSISDGRLLPRGYHIIDAFDHKKHERSEQQLT